MRFKWTLLALLLLAQSSWAAVKIEHWQNTHSSRVYFVQTPALPMLDVRVSFDAGSARDEAQFGLAALTSAMLESGSGEWDADQVAQRFESVGANFSTGLSKDMAWLSLRSLVQPELLESALTSFQTAITHPRFAEDDFQREKARTLAGLKHREESPAAIASMAFQKALYQDHPYAHPEEGLVQTVSGFEAADVKNFYQKHYVASNAIIVIIGDINRQKAEQIANQLVSGLAIGEKPQEIPAIQISNQATEQRIAFPSSQTHVLVGMPGTYRKDPDYFALYVGNHILGGGSLVSRLFDEVREKRGLAYTASSQFAPLYRNGPFTLGLQTRNDQADKALAVANATLKEFVENGPTEKELNAAKQNIMGGFAMRVDTNSKLLDYVTMIGFYQQPLDYLEMFQTKIQAVTVADVKEVFKRRIHPEWMQTIMVGARER